MLVIFFTIPYQFLNRFDLGDGYVWSRWVYFYGNRPPNAVRDALGVAIPIVFLGLGWILALRSAWHGWRSRWVVAIGLGMPLLLVAALAPAYPRVTHDVFHYISESRTLWVYGDNPLLTPPQAHPEDPISRFVRVWRDTPSPYGPGWALINFFPGLAGDDPFRLYLSFKLFSGLFLAGCTALIYLIVRRLSPARAPLAVVAFGWNPLVILIVGDAGVNDPIMLFFLLAGLYFAIDRRWPASFAFMALATGIKFVPLLAGPPLALYALRAAPGRRERLAVCGAAAAAALLLVGLFLPFWEGPRTLAAVRGQDDYFLESLAAVLMHLGLREGWSYTPLVERILYGCYLLFFVGASALLLRQLRRPPLFRELLVTAALVVFAYLAVGAVLFQPWYLLWLAALLAVALPMIGVAPLATLAAGGLGVVLVRQSTWQWEPEREIVKDSMFFLMWAVPTGAALAAVWLAKRRRARTWPAGHDARPPGR